MRKHFATNGAKDATRCYSQQFLYFADLKRDDHDAHFSVRNYAVDRTRDDHCKIIISSQDQHHELTTHRHALRLRAKERSVYLVQFP